MSFSSNVAYGKCFIGAGIGDFHYSRLEEKVPDRTENYSLYDLRVNYSQGSDTGNPRHAFIRCPIEGTSFYFRIERMTGISAEAFAKSSIYWKNDSVWLEAKANASIQANALSLGYNFYRNRPLTLSAELGVATGRLKETYTLTGAYQIRSEQDNASISQMRQKHGHFPIFRLGLVHEINRDLNIFVYEDFYARGIHSTWLGFEWR